MTGSAASVSSTTFKNTNAGPNSVIHQSPEYQVRDEFRSGIFACMYGLLGNHGRCEHPCRDCKTMRGCVVYLTLGNLNAPLCQKVSSVHELTCKSSSSDLHAIRQTSTKHHHPSPLPSDSTHHSHSPNHHPPSPPLQPLPNHLHHPHPDSQLLHRQQTLPAPL
jgi:hypothetical protein